MVRMNAGVKLGEDIIVRKPEKVSEARTITIAPTEPVRFSGDPEYFFSQILVNKPVVEGDTIAIDLLGSTFYFIVTHTTPKGIVIVTPRTGINISSEIAKKGAKKQIPK